MDVIIGKLISSVSYEQISQDSTTVNEGKAKMIFPFKETVFYNPVQEFNRDISICVINSYLKYREIQEIQPNKLLRRLMKKDKKAQTKIETVDGEVLENDPIFNTEFDQLLNINEKPPDKIVVCEALAATGLRAVRYCLEIDGVYKVIANDMQPHAVNTIILNSIHNKVNEKLIPTKMEATKLLAHLKFPLKYRPDVIDLDPYGSASPFIDAAVQAISDNGLLCVTCTDMASLCGNNPESAYSKYGSVPVKSPFCHEMALRILLFNIDSTANRYKRYIIPLLSISVDFYIRVFVRVSTEATEVKKSFLKKSYVDYCSGCHSFYLYPIATETKKGMYKASSAPIGFPKCSECSSTTHIAGPVWSSIIHQQDFVKSCISEVTTNKSKYGTSSRVEGILNLVLEELTDSPFYYVPDELFTIIRSHTAPSSHFRSALISQGYSVSFSHCKRNSIKTNAPPSVIWDIVRAWALKNPEKCGVPKSFSGKTILSKQSLTPIELDYNSYTPPPSVVNGLSRYPENPAANWGPMKRGRVGEVGERKKVNDQPYSLDPPSN